MIRAELKESGGRYFVRLKGHAEAGPKGRDIVCAAVSGVVHSLAEMLERTEDIKVHRRRIESGSAVLDFSGGEKAEGAYLVLYHGLKRLAAGYPESIIIES